MLNLQLAPQRDHFLIALSSSALADRRGGSGQWH
jgi:hypothetical protein